MQEYIFILITAQVSQNNSESWFWHLSYYNSSSFVSSGTCSACLLFHPSHWLKCWTGQVFPPGWHWSINQYSLERETQQVMNSNNPTTSYHHPSHPISYVVVFLFSVEMGMEEGTKMIGVHYCKRKTGSWRYIRMLFGAGDKTPNQTDLRTKKKAGRRLWIQIIEQHRNRWCCCLVTKL